MSNFCPKEIVKIARRYDYKVELVCFECDSAYLRISEPYFKSPYPRFLDSEVRSYRYVKRLFDSAVLPF